MLPPLHGTRTVPGDKSISHRALILAALARGESVLSGIPENADVASTICCLRNLGVVLEEIASGTWRVLGSGRLQAPDVPLDCGNSGTTMRLLAGVLSAQSFASVLDGDESLRRRPMSRVIVPLAQMGADIQSQGGQAPLHIQPVSHPLQGIFYALPVASAQVKSAMLLAGLFAEGETVITEPLPTRDHTERLLSAMGVSLTRAGSQISMPGRQASTLRPLSLNIPGDPSSAAFWMVAALGVPGSRLEIRNILLNPTRTGAIRALQRWGANLTEVNVTEQAGEPVGTLLIEASTLIGDLEIAAEEVPGLIDELPILAVAAVFANGSLTVRGAEELRVKETDRIAALASEFAKLGIPMTTFPEGFHVEGSPDRHVACPKQLLSSHGDHRIALALQVLNRLADTRPWPLDGAEWAKVSYPEFFQQLWPAATYL